MRRRARRPTWSSASSSGEEHLAANATKYPLDRIAAHWLTLAGLLLVVVLLVRTLAAVRARDRLPSKP